MDTFLIITADELVAGSRKIWGDGSWIDPKRREALEWFMFARIMGWSAWIISNQQVCSDISDRERVKWIIIACDPEKLSFQVENWLIQLMESKSVLVLIRSGRVNTKWQKKLGIYFSPNKIAGKNIRWLMADDKSIQAEQLNSILQSRTLKSTGNLIPLLFLNNHILIGELPYKESKIISIGFHPIEAMDENKCMIRIIKHLLTEYSPSPVAWRDWKNTMALRMDDPGSSEIVYHNIYKDCNKLNKTQWEKLGFELKKQDAKLSVGYVNGWVDNGDESLGRLKVKSKLVQRRSGTIYPSQEIVFDSVNNGVYDFREEYESLNKLKNDNLVSIETHGYTHIYPDTKRWLSSDSKFNDKKWFREFGRYARSYYESNTNEHHPLNKARNALAKYWHEKPMVLIFPGDEFALNDQLDALRFGWQMISSYYHAIRINGRFCWTQFICSPYLDQHDSKWIDSELPFIGYFHDFDLYRNGIGWFIQSVEKWKSLGIENIIDLRTLLEGFNFTLTLMEEDDQLSLDIHNGLNISSDYNHHLMIKVNRREFPGKLMVQYHDNAGAIKWKADKELNAEKGNILSLKFSI